jgi:hypothetical protein
VESICSAFSVIASRSRRCVFVSNSEPGSTEGAVTCFATGHCRASSFAFRSTCSGVRPVISS